MELYLGGVYLHRGKGYLVDHISYKSKSVQVKLIPKLNYLTSSLSRTSLSVEARVETSPLLDVAHFGLVKSCTCMHGYSKVNLYSLGVFESVYYSECPPGVEFLTTAMWVDIGKEALDGLFGDGLKEGEELSPLVELGKGKEGKGNDGKGKELEGKEEGKKRERRETTIQPSLFHLTKPSINPMANPQSKVLFETQALQEGSPPTIEESQSEFHSRSALEGVIHALQKVLKIHHGISDVRVTRYLQHSLMVYDTIPGGVGIADYCLARLATLLVQTKHLVQTCACEFGCVLCVFGLHTQGRVLLQVCFFALARVFD